MGTYLLVTIWTWQKIKSVQKEIRFRVSVFQGRVFLSTYPRSNQEKVNGSGVNIWRLNQIIFHLGSCTLCPSDLITNWRIFGQSCKIEEQIDGLVCLGVNITKKGMPSCDDIYAYWFFCLNIKRLLIFIWPYIHG